MILNTTTMLDRIIAATKKRGIDVCLIENEIDGTEIGELKSGKIILNTKARDTLSLIFTVAHLFGHSIQFRNYNKYKHLIEVIDGPIPIKPSQEFKEEFWEYEKEAFCLGKSLMIEAFPVSAKIDSKYQMFMLVDFEHFWQYITTGKISGVTDFNRQLDERYKQSLHFESQLDPLPIPIFNKESISSARVTIF